MEYLWGTCGVLVEYLWVLMGVVLLGFVVVLLVPSLCFSHCCIQYISASAIFLFLA